MSTQAPPRGALLGRSYLAEDEAIEVIRYLRDGVHLFCYLQMQVGGQGLLAGRLVRAEKVLIRVVRELEDALGSSADE
jgi:hypothetical protein